MASSLTDRIVGLLAEWKAAGKTQTALGQEIGAPQGTVQRWWNGESLPKAENLARLPDLFDISGHWLLTGEGPRAAPGKPGGGDYEAGYLAGLEAARRALEGAGPPLDVTGLEATRGAELYNQPPHGGRAAPGKGRKGRSA